MKMYLKINIPERKKTVGLGSNREVEILFLKGSKGKPVKAATVKMFFLPNLDHGEPTIEVKKMNGTKIIFV